MNQYLKEAFKSGITYWFLIDGPASRNQATGIMFLYVSHQYVVVYYITNKS